jgi:hypothetical protein
LLDDDDDDNTVWRWKLWKRSSLLAMVVLTTYSPDREKNAEFTERPPL